MCDVRIYVTHNQYDVSCLNTMLHTEMCNVRTYAPHEYDIWSVWTSVTYENM